MTTLHRFTTVAAIAALVAACSREPAEPAQPAPVEPVATPSSAPAVAYACQSGQAVSVQYTDAPSASLAYRGRTYLLRSVEAASGARYSGSGVQWWTATRDGVETATLGRVSATDGGVAAILERCTRTLPTTASAPVATAAPCKVAQLTLSSEGGDAGMGNRVATLGLRNTGAQACSLSGYPTVVLLDGADKPLTAIRNEQTQGNYFRAGTTPTPVTLAPQAKGYFDIAWNVVPHEGAGETVCPSATTVRMTVPGDTASATLAQALSPCGGYLRVSPIRPVSEDTSGSAPPIPAPAPKATVPPTPAPKAAPGRPDGSAGNGGRRRVTGRPDAIHEDPCPLISMPASPPN